MIHSYRRCSTDDQPNGPVAQAEAIAAWVARHSTTNVSDAYKDFFDDGVSGAVPLAERPQGVKMCAALQPGDTVVAAKLDRLFRSVADAAITMDAWAKRDIRLVSIAEGFDPTSIYGRAMIQLVSVFAELERGMIRQRTKEAMASRKSRGLAVGHPPYGWANDGDGLLVPIDNEQTILTGILSLARAGMSPLQIARHLNKKRVLPKLGEQWYAKTVYRILKNTRSRLTKGA